LAAQPAAAITLVNFAESPSTTTPEFSYSGGSGGLLTTAAGATDLDLNFTLSSTNYTEGDLVLSGLSASAPAVVSGSLVTQPLNGGGSFSLLDDSATVLLAGTITDAFIQGVLGSSVGTVLSATVAYTGGTEFDPSYPTGGFSFSLTGVVPTLSSSGSPAYLNAFSADGTGLFDGTLVPLPAAAWAGMGLLGALGAARIRRRRSA
jgi:hypothetical protein